MGTEVVLSITSLRSQLESERSSLFKIDESIKKIVQTPRFLNDRFNTGGEFGRNVSRLGNRNSFPEPGNNAIKNEEFFGKRKHETKTVFSRLSARADESDGEDERGLPKRNRISSTVSRELPSRADVLKAQGGDEAAKGRNRRMFGSLLGTLQKFKQEEIVLQNKEDKKAQVERKIEEQERQKKELAYKERKTLFAEREQRKDKIKTLEVKVARLSEFERWESSQKTLGNFILTKSQPCIYWLPKKVDGKAEELLVNTRSCHDELMQTKRNNLQEYLARIEMLCMRRRHAPNENLPHPPAGEQEGPGGNARDFDREPEGSDEGGDVTMCEEEGDVTMREVEEGVNGDQEMPIKEENKESTEITPKPEHTEVNPEPADPVREGSPKPDDPTDP